MMRASHDKFTSISFATDQNFAAKRCSSAHGICMLVLEPMQLIPIDFEFPFSILLMEEAISSQELTFNQHNVHEWSHINHKKLQLNAATVFNKYMETYYG